ncbi:flagellar basal body L-ring protein FlgH [Arcobacter porcinus]|uniref:Flagellar L-ring protein n=1 Tax=Arcobacter porcinus TaxID=1935204 RepID=A0A1C0AWX1_9BACT|nr:flagellar basal body L-ring protein FlgH [Arcobacter porcinus]OCL84568.1 Flagellar L-ring protein precursor [Arcobacter porcinus]OCL91530.1 Flagellar L-ring protein precursor [Arcobacter porcinus]OCL97136.1 Flagellar L-ring protein precursor [Aliarcobacter thereius]QEP39863.1 flagellar outer membrane L-ring protein FlgH [Arcobacter porcinus]
MKRYLLACIPFIFASCSSMDRPEIEFTKPEHQVVRDEPKVKRNKGSLYSVQGSSLFADKKDLQIGDIIQIRISEGLQQKTDNKRELTSNRQNEFGGGMFTSVGGNTLGGTMGSATDRINANLGVNFGTNSSDSDKGKVKTEVKENFDTDISAIIEEVYQNGNYFIKGTKEVLLDGQKQEIIITGIIRPYDISPENSINSSQIANLKLLYKKDGDEADILQAPWGTRFLRSIWPF